MLGVLGGLLGTSYLTKRLAQQQVGYWGPGRELECGYGCWREFWRHTCTCDGPVARSDGGSSQNKWQLLVRRTTLAPLLTSVLFLGCAPHISSVPFHWLCPAAPLGDPAHARPCLCRPCLCQPPSLAHMMQVTGRGPSLLLPARPLDVEGADGCFESGDSYTVYELQRVPRAAALEPTSPRHNNRGHGRAGRQSHEVGRWWGMAKENEAGFAVCCLQCVLGAIK